jgi:hypothetical protein
MLPAVRVAYKKIIMTVKCKIFGRSSVRVSLKECMWPRLGVSVVRFLEGGRGFHLGLTRCDRDSRSITLLRAAALVRRRSLLQAGTCANRRWRRQIAAAILNLPSCHPHEASYETEFDTQFAAAPRRTASFRQLSPRRRLQRQPGQAVSRA